MNTTDDDRLKAAAQEGDINLLYTLIQEDPKVLESADSIQFVETPLHTAASFGQLQFATEVMRLKPSFAEKLNQQGFSPIHLAMQQGQKRVVLGFVKINKDLVRVTGREGLTPLHFACQTGDVDLLTNFLSACPESIKHVTVRSETALHVALKNEQYEALQVLLGWLKRTDQKDAMELEKTILNWKDEAGNTILHISALNNDLQPQVLRLLVKTGMDLNAKNVENSTALDIAANEEIKSILCGAGATHSSSVTGAPTDADKLTSNITVEDKIVISVLRIRRDISEVQRYAYLVVATLVLLATIQLALSPPGGVYDHANANANASQGNIIAGTSVMSQRDFFAFLFLNTLSLLASTMAIHVLIPSGVVGFLFLTPVSWLSYCYLFSMKVISPTFATSTFIYIMLILFPIMYIWLFIKFSKAYERLN